MRSKYRLVDSIFFILMGILYSFSVSSAFFSASALSINTVTLFLLNTILVIFFSVIVFNKYTVITFVFCVLLIIGAVLVLQFNEQLQQEWFFQIKELIKDIYLFSNQKIPYREEFEFPLAFLVSFFIAFFTVLCTQVHFTFFAMTIFAISIFFMPTTSGNENLGLAFFVIAFCVVVFLIKRMNMYAHGKSDEISNIRSYQINTIIIFCFGISAFMISWYLPKPQIEAIDIVGTIRNTDFTQLGESILDKLNAKSIKPVTFSNKRGELGGPIKLNDNVVMTVTAQERVFLSGKVYDTYTGRGWVVDDTEKKAIEKSDDDDYILPFFAYNLEGSNIDSEMFNADLDICVVDYYTNEEQKSVTINMENNTTKTIFMPQFASVFNPKDVDEKFILQVDNMGQLSSKGMLPAQTEYTLNYSGYNKRIAYSNSSLYDDASIGSLDSYLSLPSTIPQRVYDLAEELTQEDYNPYEKMDALKEYLSMFPYTLSPGKVPSGSDIVDHFLFEERKGYCVYYASSLAIMGRAVGVPTRYVEGYIMPRLDNDDGTYTVTNKQAHAWVEAFINPYGWMPIDATAPEYSVLSESVVIGGGANTKEPDINSEILAPKTQQQHIDASSSKSQENIQSPVSSGSTSQLYRDTEEEKGASHYDEKKSQVSFWKILFVVTVLVLAVCSLIYKRDIKYYIYMAKFKRYRKKSNKLSANNIFFSIVKEISKKGYPIKKSETADQYAKRIAENFEFDDIYVDIHRCVRIFYKASYSNIDISDKEIEDLIIYFFRLFNFNLENV